MDTVKKSFVLRMKALSQSTQEIYSSEAHIADVNLTATCQNVQLM